MTNPVDGERTVHSDATSAVARTRDTWTKAAIVASVAAAFGGLLFLLPGKTKPAVETNRPLIRQYAPFERAPLPVEKAALKPPAVLSGTTGTIVEAAIVPVASVTDPLLDSARRAPVTAFSKAAPLAPDPAGLAALTSTNEASDKGAFERQLKAPKLDGARAGLIGNRDMVVAMGTSIPCVLETALQSDQPGFTSCLIDRDVLSHSGHVVLMEKGTQVVGEYRGGLKAGQSRLHVLWIRAQTPTGVVIDLASAATDGLGRAGVDGAVDTHFFERFGAAVLLSVVSDLTRIGGQLVQDKSGYSANGTAGSGKDAASLAVEQSAAIAPTLHKHQGEVVSIFVSRDLDFSGVYRLERAGPVRAARNGSNGLKE
jgi:type IV secretion system protein VirB10